MATTWGAADFGAGAGAAGGSDAFAGTGFGFATAGLGLGAAGFALCITGFGTGALVFWAALAGAGVDGDGVFALDAAGAAAVCVFPPFAALGDVLAATGPVARVALVALGLNGP